MHGWGMKTGGDRDSHRENTRIADVFATQIRVVIRPSISSI